MLDLYKDLRKISQTAYKNYEQTRWKMLLYSCTWKSLMPPLMPPIVNEISQSPA
jgi:hypothetical protein